MSAVLLDPTKQWACPSCGVETVTKQALPHVPMHQCAALNGLLAPFVPADELASSRLVAVERDDYVGNQIVQTDDSGRPIMAVRTERADGSNDTLAFAPSATAVL